MGDTIENAAKCLHLFRLIFDEKVPQDEKSRTGTIALQCLAQIQELDMRSNQLDAGTDHAEWISELNYATSPCSDELVKELADFARNEDEAMKYHRVRRLRRQTGESGLQEMQEVTMANDQDLKAELAEKRQKGRG